MAELDLSKAYEAAGKAFASGYDSYPAAAQRSIIAYVTGPVDAALPHILDALAEQAEGEASATLARRFLPRMANGEPFPDMSEPARASKWLRKKAEELRNA